MDLESILKKQGDYSNSRLVRLANGKYLVCFWCGAVVSDVAVNVDRPFAPEDTTRLINQWDLFLVAERIPLTFSETFMAEGDITVRKFTTPGEQPIWLMERLIKAYLPKNEQFSYYYLLDTQCVLVTSTADNEPLAIFAECVRREEEEYEEEE